MGDVDNIVLPLPWPIMTSYLFYFLATDTGIDTDID